ncbi:MAG: hypothetical protein A4E32_01540 [Methanomassiliicoccales archaeon PtaU1.Bin124]|nr:MAG: hypothetical protein A4E32_01540 [Methanomassiliicoccales archaeon PtaU1.Bin124]
MRKLIVLSFITLDGVMQAPGGPDEDVSGGFRHGGWTVPYLDEFANNVMMEQMGRPYDLLLGRRTYDIFASYWPYHRDMDMGINKATKYVVSRSPMTFTWEGSVQLQGDVAEAVRKLKDDDGPDIQVHGSGDLIQTLFKHDLVDELWLKTFPLTLGPGKRLFADGVIPAAFKLMHCATSPKGVIIAEYGRSGDVVTGSF